MKSISFLLTIFSLLVIPCLSQNTAKGAAEAYKSLDRVVKKNGWNIPVEAEKYQGASWAARIENYSVTIQSYELAKPVEMKWDSYALRNEDNSLKITERGYTFEVRTLAAYIAEGKVFAYELKGVPTTITLNGLRSYAGAVISSFYVDEDGDGIFETRYMSKLPDKIPDWIIKDKSRIFDPL